MVLACRAVYDFQEISVFVLGGQFWRFCVDFGSIFGAKIDQKAIRTLNHRKKKNDRSWKASGQRLEIDFGG